MKTLLLLVVLCCASAALGDLVCGSDYCRRHPCPAPAARSACPTPAVYREKHSGQCACCPACVTLLGEGAACKIYSAELGETPSAVCREPLKCLRGACTTVQPRK